MFCRPPMHVCVSGVCGSIKGTRAGAKTQLVVENRSAAKYNNCRSPEIAGYSVSHGFPCQTTHGSLLKPPVQACRAGPFATCADTDAPDSPFYSPSTHGESRPSRFSDAAAPSSHHLQSSYHRRPLKKRIARRKNLWISRKKKMWQYTDVAPFGKAISSSPTSVLLDQCASKQVFSVMSSKLKYVHCKCKDA